MVKNKKNAGIITVSCGIGKSFEEACNAAIKAKKLKGKKKYQIQIYKGRRLRSKLNQSIKDKVNSYLKLYRTLSKEQRELLKNFALRDSITGMLNKIGFVLKMKRFKEGYYVLLDLDNVHYWNKKLGYAKVDEIIELIGKEILSHIRHKEGSFHKKRMIDVIGHRLHESAGDEFLIFVPSKHSMKNLGTIKEVVKRIISGVYKKQKEL